jgi:hypothetical protein
LIKADLLLVFSIAKGKVEIIANVSNPKVRTSLFNVKLISELRDVNQFPVLRVHKKRGLS